MLRVLHVIEAVEAGVARHVTDLVCHVEAEHLVLAAPDRVGGYTDTTAFETIERAGGRIHLAPMRRSMIGPGNAKAVRVARRLIRDERPDVVHGHAAIGGGVARVAAAGTSAACVYTPHCLLPRRTVMGMERVLGRITDGLIAVSRSEADLVSRRRIVPVEKVTVIPNGIDPDRSDPPELDLRSRLGVGGETQLVGSVGRLAAQKAPEIFIRVCERLARSSDACFVLVGDGPLRQEVAEEISDSGLGRRFLHVPGLQDAASVMSQLDAFVLASRYEAGPYAPLEAMRAGVPVVLTDVAGNRDCIVAGESGLLAAPDDPGALAAAVASVLEDPDLGGRLAAAARERLIADFDVRRMAARTERKYAETIGG